MNRFAARMTKLEKAKSQGGRRVHFIVLNPGEDAEQCTSHYLAEKRFGENDVLFIMDLSAER